MQLSTLYGMPVQVEGSSGELEILEGVVNVCSASLGIRLECKTFNFLRRLPYEFAGTWYRY